MLPGGCVTSPCRAHPPFTEYGEKVDIHELGFAAFYEAAHHSDRRTPILDNDMPFVTEPEGYKKTILSDLQGAWGIFRDSVVKAAGFEILETPRPGGVFY